MSECDERGHPTAATGIPPGRGAVEGGPPGEGAGDAPADGEVPAHEGAAAAGVAAPEDVVQAVAEFVDDLVEDGSATPADGPGGGGR